MTEHQLLYFNSHLQYSCLTHSLYLHIRNILDENHYNLHLALGVRNYSSGIDEKYVTDIKTIED